MCLILVGSFGKENGVEACVWLCTEVLYLNIKEVSVLYLDVSFFFKWRLHISILKWSSFTLLKGKRGCVNNDMIASFEETEDEIVSDDEEDCEDDWEEDSDSKDKLDIKLKCK